MQRFLVYLFYILLFTKSATGQSCDSLTSQYDSLAIRFAVRALGENKAYEVLNELCTTIGARMTGSSQAARAVEWAKTKMEEFAFQHVRTQPVMVPHWVRGTEEGYYTIVGNGNPSKGVLRTPLQEKKFKLHICALGGSIATPKNGISSEIVEVDSWEALAALGEKVKGRIVFYNRPMARTVIIPGAAYGQAVDQRSRGAIEAAKLGAVATLVRSMTMRIDDVPHTGQMQYDSAVTKIPSAAISTNDANTLSSMLARGKNVRVTLRLHCKSLPVIESANVIGEIVGSEKPEEIVLLSAHLDSWDKGQGAHDDGAGCAHVLEALRIIKELGLKPKRTIRVILFMNEEFGLSGGLTYAVTRESHENHIAAIETDAGGFCPRGFTISDSSALKKLTKFAYAFRPIDAERLTIGHGGADIGPLIKAGIVGIGLQTDGQKYFDYHHSDNDIIRNVNERELALGASALATLAYIIAQEGI